MTEYDIAEQSFKNGYTRGYSDACRDKAREEEQRMKQAKWVSVKDKLPKCERGCEVGDIAYVVKASNTVLCGCYGRGGKYRDSYFRTWNDASDGVDASDVSFWTPLPKPPEVRDGNT